MKITKGFYQKNEDNTYSHYMPFGTDGQLVDMISGLNLEYELKLGTEHDVQIHNDSNTLTTIIEDYAAPNNVGNGKYYRVITSINDDPEQPEIVGRSLTTQIITELRWIDHTVDPSIDNLLKTKITNIFVILDEDGDTVIEETYV